MIQRTINHIIGGYLQQVYCLHSPESKKEIEDIKNLFIVFLKNAISQERSSEEYSLEILREILEKSNFDWMDYDKFDRFTKEVCCIGRKKYRKNEPKSLKMPISCKIRERQRSKLSLL